MRQERHGGCLCVVVFLANVDGVDDFWRMSMVSMMSLTMLKMSMVSMIMSMLMEMSVHRQLSTVVGFVEAYRNCRQFDK